MLFAQLGDLAFQFRLLLGLLGGADTCFAGCVNHDVTTLFPSSPDGPRMICEM
jgi:hypothetical protein